MESGEVSMLIAFLEITENSSKSCVPSAILVPLPIVLKTLEQLTIILSFLAHMNTNELISLEMGQL